MTVHLPLLTNSRARTYHRCAREHQLAYELGWRSVTDEADALRRGTLLHAALEAWLLAPAAQRLSAALAALDGAADAYELVLLEVLVCGYDARWAGEPLEVLAVEREFRAPLVNPATGSASRTFDLGGKLDAVVLMHGAAYVMEHKSTSEDIGAGSRYWQRLQLDAQVSQYYEGARSLGFDVAGCLYDVIGKPRHLPLEATPPDKRRYSKSGALHAAQREEPETPEQYRERLTDVISAEPDRFFRRGMVVRLEDEERDAGFDRWQTARAIRESQLADRWPRNSDACERYHRMCQFFPVCTHTASLEDRSAFERLEHVHPELSSEL